MPGYAAAGNGSLFFCALTCILFWGWPNGHFLLYLRKSLLCLLDEVGGIGVFSCFWEPVRMITSPRAASALVATLACLSVVFDSAPAFGAMQLNQVVSGLTNPLFVGHAGDNSNRLFIVERVGVIKVLQPGSSTPTIFLNITTKVRSGGERGLTGLAFHPLYENNGRFFVFYTRESTVTADVGDIVIAEYGVSAANENVADPTETVLLTIEHTQVSTHNGGMMAFDFDGYLRIGVGDGGSSGEPVNNAQVIGTLLGKILRIDVDVPPPALYSSPPSNPYVGVTGRDEIFSIGWRNPWRWSFDRQTGQQWVADVGQDAREEVDTPIVNGGNYGWRVFEGIACNTYPASTSPCAFPRTSCFQSSTTHTPVNAARSSAAMSIGAHRARCRSAPTSTAISAPARSSPGTAPRRPLRWTPR